MPRYTSRRPVPRAYVSLDEMLRMIHASPAYRAQMASLRRMPPLTELEQDEIVFGPVWAFGKTLERGRRWAEDNREAFLGLIARLPVANPPPDMAG